jgi:1-acyl-sn-glycerol-3-phosphate acyltransferase
MFVSAGRMLFPTALWYFHSNLYEVPHDDSKQYVFVFNHISYLDIPIIMKTDQETAF